MVRLVGDEGVMKGIKITSHLSDTLPVIRANVAYVGQALLNLLVNALEHTPSGTIEVKTYLKKEEAGDKVVIEVKDSGTGIDPDRMDSIFEPLTSFGKTQGRVLSVNAGMGLHFVKRIMEAHEGEVRVRSVLGEGTVFFLVFPAIKTASE